MYSDACRWDDISWSRFNPSGFSPYFLSHSLDEIRSSSVGMYQRPFLRAAELFGRFVVLLAGAAAAGADLGRLLFMSYAN